ncbi:hypothetical protein [Croceicoccus bisphenolivorans]|uniref:hypothetical protein n=1 Tax=Croceicoccus bisphenolivorans TaxID=1783232 RepID=UPI00082DBA2A|nr:hypothetical protein [Croceicoccus bisphenolivorans]
MARPRIVRGLAPALLLCGLFVSLPVSAETLEELDALSDQSADAPSGISMAQEQAKRGEYLDALATLERVLAANPKSHEARLIHAVYLCRIDDRQGGRVELAKLKKKYYSDGLLDEARAMCEPAEKG